MATTYLSSASSAAAMTASSEQLQHQQDTHGPDSGGSNGSSNGGAGGGLGVTGSHLTGTFLSLASPTFSLTYFEDGLFNRKIRVFWVMNYYIWMLGMDKERPNLVQHSKRLS